jgi:hypothetical protein
MARIPMTGGFQIMPEGEQVLKIVKAEYDEDFGKATFTLENAKRQTCMERFSLLNQDGSPNEKALGAFSFFAKTALNDFDIEDVDPVELVGHYIKAEVIHNKVPSTKDPSKMMTFVNLGSKSPADGFEGAPTPTSKPHTGGLDLNALLGG